ncbi:hypothetical protein ABZT27_34415 [Streptomyces sp. NPDC005389]|uniref:hypothetical protein n=1 Tax=Streptomyces sp. NPDC005389 TaxID=3157040 RepID=UPI0033B48ED9
MSRTRNPIPPTEPCTDPRHTGRIREQLGCVGPDPAARVEPPTEREYWLAIAYALNAATRAGLPVGIDLDGTLTDHDAHSVVWNHEAERWEVAGYDDEDQNGAPEADPESPAEIVARVVALLDSLDAVTYAIVRPDTAATIDVVGRARGMDPAHGVEGLRSMADAIAIRDAQRRAIAHEAEEAPAPTADTSDTNGQRLRAKAQVLREAADDIESRNNGCTVPGILGLCPVCQTRSAEAAKLRTAATELELHAAARPATCTCGVPTDTTAVHRADAPCYVKDTDQ